MLLALIFLSFTVPGFVRAVRMLPWVDDQVMGGIKPWSCDVCMTFWSLTILWLPVASFVFGLDAVIATPPAYFIALVLLERSQEAHQPFPEPPE